MAEAFGGTHRVLVINPYIPARTELIGAATADANSRDVGKPVKLNGAAVTLAGYGDEIYGFIESVEAGTKNGYSVGGVLCDRGCEAYARDEAGTLAVGDFVVGGTPTALKTALPVTGANVIKAQASSMDQLLNVGGLAIKAGGSPLARTVNITRAMLNGNLVVKAAGDMAALSGTIAANAHNVYCFFMDGAGTLSTVMGTAGATAAAVEFPPIPAGRIMLGFVLVTHTSSFVGGTTALDASGATAVYVDTATPLGATSAHQWQVMAKYSAGTYSGSVLLRKV